MYAIRSYYAWNEYNKDGTLILSTEYNMGEIISETVSTPVEDISH